ncbi:hypothetical protein RHS01_06107 [Rhizoctonia solani]|uniref:Uncharacterized protein n=1 Tax=Rhizoctonia solani TaxID=456999 RepID=A0A8H7ID33_9AGAM|nr:hypothetical protein RHS01_06107 [Rhizoctonia solani]
MGPKAVRRPALFQPFALCNDDTTYQVPNSPLHNAPTRQRTFRPKRQIRNGALLAVSEAAKLINVPLAQDVAKHVKQLIVALKPSVLQAPKTNDSEAQNLANRVKGLKDVLRIPIQYLEDSEVNAVGSHRDMLEEFCGFQTLLSTTYTELQKIQESSYTNKLASQAEIRERILHLKEELSRTVVDFTLRLLVIVLASSAQGQILITRRLNSAAREHKTLACKHGALVREHPSFASTEHWCGTLGAVNVPRINVSGV